MNPVFRWLGLDPFTEIDRITAFRFTAEPWLPMGAVWALLAVGLLLAALNFLPAIKMQPRVRLTCFLLRLGMVGLLLLIVMRMHLKLDIGSARAQSWLALVDDSGSMATADERGGARLRAAVDDLDAVRDRVGGKVTIETATLSKAPLGAVASEKTGTYLSAAILRELGERPPFQRLLLLTDGRALDGQELTLAGEALKSRGVALDVALYGTTTPTPDAAISAQPERTVIRLGESLVIRGSLKDPSGSTACELTLQEDGKKVSSASIPRESYGWFEFLYRPKNAGLHRYTVSMPGSDSYQTNNACSFIADIRDEKINVLMIEGAPRYEFKLLKAALETDPLVHLVTICHLPGVGPYVQGGALHEKAEEGIIKSEPELYKYDIVILRDVPRTLFRTANDQSEASMKLLVEFVQKRGGGFIAMGGQDVYRAGGYQDSPLAAILPFDLTDSISKEAQFPGMFPVDVVNDLHGHPLLRLLPDDSANREHWKKMRMLDGCNNVGALKPMAKPLLSRRASIRAATGATNVVEVPVLAYQDLGEGKVLAASVDTFWRWQLQPDFDMPPLETLMGNAVRYMAPEPGQRAGRVNVAVVNPTPSVGQTVVLSSLLRDKSYTPIRGADLKVVVRKPDGQRETIYPCDLPDRPGYYEYRVLADQPGDWTVMAIQGKETSTNKFVVREPDGEYANLAADPDGMKAFVAVTGGTVVEDLKAWAKGVDVGPLTEPVARDLEMWNSPAIMVLFILLVCVDCYVRKRRGMV